MSKIVSNRIASRDGVVDLEVKHLLVRDSAMENLGEYEQGIELKTIQQYFVKDGIKFTGKAFQLPLVLTGDWKTDEVFVETYGDQWDHDKLYNKDTPNAHDASAIRYKSGNVADKLDDLADDVNRVGSLVGDGIDVHNHDPNAHSDLRDLIGAGLETHNHDPLAHPELSGFISSEADRSETAAEKSENILNAVQNTNAEKVFKSKDDLDSFPDAVEGMWVVVVDDATHENNGYYQRQGGVWEKTALQPAQRVDAPFEQNREKNYPLKPMVREGIISAPYEILNGALLDIEIIAPEEIAAACYFRFAYFQNGATLNGNTQDGVRIELFTKEGYANGEEGISVHTPTDPPLVIDRDLGGIQVNDIVCASDSRIRLRVTFDVDKLPPLGTPINSSSTASNANSRSGWSWIIDPVCVKSKPAVNSLMINKGESFPFALMTREGEASQRNSAFDDVFLDVKVTTTKEQASSKYFKISYLQNGATLFGKTHNGIRVEMFERESYASLGEGVSIHAPDDPPLDYDREKGGVQRVAFYCEGNSNVFIELLLDVDALPPSGTAIGSSNYDNAGWSWIVDPACVQEEMPRFFENRGKNFPFLALERKGITSLPSAIFNNAFLGVEVTGPYELVTQNYFKISYLQNGATLSGKTHNGIRVEMFDKETYKELGEGISIHTPQDSPAEYDRALGGIQTFTIVCAHDSRIQLKVTLDVDALPPSGTPVNASTEEWRRAWSWVIDPVCVKSSAKSVEDIRKNQGVNFPLAPKTREGRLSPASDVLNDALLAVKVFAAPELALSKYFRIAYLQNGAMLSGKAHNGIRIEMYDKDTYELEGSGISIHTPPDEPAGYDIDLGGVQTFEIVCALERRVKLQVTLDVDMLPPKGTPVNASSNAEARAWSWVIDPACVISAEVAASAMGTANTASVSGAMAIGASLINAVNGWFEKATKSLNIIGINKAVGGTNPYYHADRIYKGVFCTDMEFENVDVLVIQYASSTDLDSTAGLLLSSSDYTVDFDPDDESNQFQGRYSHAQCVDYILKYWRERCYEQRNNSNSKWFGTQFGKPFRVMFVSHWHDARYYYNDAIRVLAKRWGASICPFDEKIGFTKETPMPDGSQVSLMYAMDSQNIDGVTYGWHPSRGSEGEYIQSHMANIFKNAMIEHYM